MADQEYENLRVTQQAYIGTGGSSDAQLHVIRSDSAEAKILLEKAGTDVLKLSVSQNVAAIGTLTKVPLQFQAAQNYGIYIKENGYVGVAGIINPNFNLDVKGIINTEQYYKNGQPWKITGDDIAEKTITSTNIKDGTITQAKLAFSIGGSQWENGNNKSIFYSGGNVGIATSSPKFSLDINGTINATQFLKNGQTWQVTREEIRDNAINADKIDNEAVTNVKIATNAVIASKIADFNITDKKLAPNAVTTEKIQDGNVTDIKLAPNAVTTEKIKNGAITKDKLDPSIPIGGGGSSQWINANAGKAIYYNEGNVGIGTKDPQDKLDVAGNLRILTNSNPIRFTSAWSSFPDSKPNQAEISNDTVSYKTLMIVGNKSAGGVRRVSVWDYLQINGGMDITGNVGIGTDTPQAKLQIANGSIMPAVGNVENAGIMFPKDAFGGGGDAAWIRYYARTGEATTLEIGISNDPDDHIALIASGNVGIGTTTPKAKLDVKGSIRARNAEVIKSNNQGAVGLSTNVEEGGIIETRNSKDKIVVQINTIAGSQDGYIGVFSSDGNEKIRLQGNGFIQASGDISCNAIYAKVKQFLIEHPEDETKNIVYSSIEGPECAAYIRGKAKLNRGQAEVAFPDHFSIVVNSTTITIQLTPRSAESKGLAVVNQSEGGFLVKELWQGEGNYEFDYFVAGVRKGLENFTPVVTKGFSAFAEPGTEAASLSAVSMEPAAVAQATKYEENS